VNRARPATRLALREVKVYEAAVSSSWTERLRGELRAPRPGAALYWYALDLTPRSFLEQVIVALQRVARPGPGCIGAEYWWRVQSAHTGLQMHFDRDEAIADRIVSPLMSSILYLSDAGGRTLIVDATPDGMVPPRHGVGVFPQRARYATFPGTLFHGVQPGAKSRWPRIAFFVNWWRSRPRTCEEPPAALLRASPLLRGGPARPKQRVRTSRAEAFRPSELLDEAGWKQALARVQRA